MNISDLGLDCNWIGVQFQFTDTDTLEQYNNGSSNSTKSLFSSETILCDTNDTNLSMVEFNRKEFENIHTDIAATKLKIYCIVESSFSFVKSCTSFLFSKLVNFPVDTISSHSFGNLFKLYVSKFHCPRVNKNSGLG